MHGVSSTGYLQQLPGNRLGLRLPSRLALAAQQDDKPEGIEGVIPDGAGVWKWIHIAPFGIHRGHPKGEIRFSRENFENIVSLFMRRQNPVKVDYEHDTLNKAVPGYDRIAAGYLHALEIRGDGFTEGSGLWGLVEFTQKASEKIRAGEFIFQSPVIVPDSIDRKTGKPVGLELVQVAITSDPFLDGQIPTTFTRMNMAEEKKIEATEQAKAVVSLADEIAADLTTVLNKLAEVTGLDQAAVVASMLDKLDPIAKLIGGQKKEEGLPSEQPASETAAKAPEAAPAAAAPAQAQATDRWTDLMQGQIQALSRQVESLNKAEQDRKRAAIESTVDGLIRQGKCNPAQRETAIWAFQADPDKAAMLFVNQVVPIGQSQLPAESPDKAVKPEAVTLSPADDMAVRQLVFSGAYTKDEAIKFVTRRS